MKINKQSLEDFRKKFKETVKPLEDELGIVIRMGKITYGYDDFSASFTVDQKPKDGKTIEQVEFEKYCHMYGCKPEDFQRKKMFGGRVMTLIGFNPRARKNNAKVMDLSGNKYNCNIRNFMMASDIEEL